MLLLTSLSQINYIVDEATDSKKKQSRQGKQIFISWQQKNFDLKRALILFNVYQAGSAMIRGESKPHTVPIVTTNLDSSH